MDAIEIQHLRRLFRPTIGVLRRTHKEIVAVDDISFNIPSGELFGLLGPNGAGKTTTVKVLATLLLPTSGTVRVLGLDIVSEARQVQSNIGFIFGGERGLYWRLAAMITCATSQVSIMSIQKSHASASRICLNW